MYNPISLNVIRQALAWHDFAPKTIKRTFSQKWPNGNITCIYHLTFPAINLQRATGYEYGLKRDEDVRQHVERINECFAGDCHVFDSHYDAASDNVTMKLYAYFEKRPTGKPRW